MKTHSVKPTDLKRQWVIVDATDQTLGRLASEIARQLRGKHKPEYTPYLECGDHVVVINAKNIKLTGNKLTKKYYYRYTGYIGGLKSVRADELLAKHPDRVVRSAVKGMLPRTKLSRKIIKNLKIYPGSEHPHEAQKPVPMTSRIAETK